MSKKVNLSTINASFVSALSGYNVALSAIRKAAEVKNAAIAEADKAEQEARENRQKAIEGGMSADDAIARFSLEPSMAMRNAAIDTYNKAVEPHKKAQKEAFSSVADSVYYAYLLTIEKMSMDAKGTLQIKKGKGTEEHKVDKSFKAEVRAFLDSVGVLGADNETALNKAADALRTLTAGAVKSNKEGEFLKAKGMNAFKDLFIRAFLQYGVKRNVLIINEDSTVTLRTYENADA